MVDVNVSIEVIICYHVNQVLQEAVIKWWSEFALYCNPAHGTPPIQTTVFARSVAAATNVFNRSRRKATIQERLLFESGVYLFDCALPQELNDYVLVFVNV